MKKLIAVFLLAILASCSSNKVFENYELSYSRSGGYAPIYENVFIKGNTVNYFFEGEGKKYSKKNIITNTEKQKLYDAIHKNDLKTIREDIKKVYDNITTTIKMKSPTESTFKNDGSFIVPAHEQRWKGITEEFERFIESKNFRNK